MDNIRIQTTQNVDINYELASIGDRILAALLDRLFFAAYILLIFLLNSAMNWFLLSSIAMTVILSLPLFLYHLLFEIFFDGRSLGKMIMKIKVVKIDGTQPTFGAYILRWLLRIIDTLLFSGAIAILAIFLSGKGQRVGDMAAGTTVIRLKQRVNLNDTILTKPKPNYTIVFSEVSKLSDQDIAIIKEVIEASIKSNNHAAIEKLAQKTKTIMGVTPQMPNAQFLTIVIQDYNHYSFDK